MDRTDEFESITERHGSHRIPSDETISILIKIAKLKHHIKKYAHDYLNTYGYLPGSSVMNEERRQKLDSDIEIFIDECQDKIKILQSEIYTTSRSPQVIGHLESVIRILSRTLHRLFLYFNQLKSTKIKRQLDKQKYDRIECSTDVSDPLSEETFNFEGLTRDTDREATVSLDECRHQSQLAAKHDAIIEPKEISFLAMENSQIYDELITFDDEIKMIGKKVVEISKLQEMFTEKVVEQAVDLDNLHETAIRSSENVREGNDLIRDAMMRNASTRVFILFYIVTLGFSILFLDWYNP